MRQLFTQWGGEGNAATEAWVLKGFPFESRDRSECERGNNSGKRRILSKPRRVLWKGKVNLHRTITVPSQQMQVMQHHRHIQLEVSKMSTISYLLFQENCDETAG